MAKGKTIAIIFAACAGLGILVIGSCAGLLYFGYKNTDSTVSPRIDAMFSAIENNTFADTYETETSQELRDAASKEQYTALGDAIGLRLGKLESKSLQGFKMRQFNADSYIDVSYNATFEHGKGTIIAKLKRVGSVWKFVTFRVNSPLFGQDIVTAKCPSCGKPHTAKAKFCSSCGAAIATNGDEQPSQDESETETSATEQRVGHGATDNADSSR
jgi:hypothetical protein